MKINPHEMAIKVLSRVYGKGDEEHVARLAEMLTGKAADHETKTKAMAEVGRTLDGFRKVLDLMSELSMAVRHASKG